MAIKIPLVKFLNHCLYQILPCSEIHLVKELCTDSLGSFLCLYLIPLGQGEDKITNSWEHLAGGDFAMGGSDQLSTVLSREKSICSQAQLTSSTEERYYLSVLRGVCKSSQFTLRKHESTQNNVLEVTYRCSCYLFTNKI